MGPEGPKRKLTAILSADVKEYSRLMSQDEMGTIRTLAAYKEAMGNLIEEYRGHVVDSPGDNLLAEFESVVDAVNCAVEIQRELAERNAEVPYNRKMEFRIGVNQGDIVHEEGRIYGDGVNVAARLESLADGGGVCISGKVYDEVKSKLGLEYEDLGDQEVKNIAEPVRVYRVLSHPGAAAHRVVQAKAAVGKRWKKIALALVTIPVMIAGAFAIWKLIFVPKPSLIEPASVERMAFPLPDKPSIAVLPFDNMSDDPEQEYLADGISETIIGSLSKVGEMFVIARHSAFSYKGKSVKVQQVAQELGVQHVLEGSVQKSGDRLRVTAQLIDATTGHHLWAESYDRELKDIFAVQDEITMKILVALRVELTVGEEARLTARGTNNLKAYLKNLEGWKYIWRVTKGNNALARKLFEEAIALDPMYSYAYGGLGCTYLYDGFLGLGKSPRQSWEQAIEWEQKAIALDESSGEGRGLLGLLYMMTRQYEKGIAQCERAVSLSPNSAGAHASLGRALYWAGRYEEAFPFFEKAIRLDPLRHTHHQGLGTAYLLAKHYEEAITEFKKTLDGSPTDVIARVLLAGTYVLSGREEEAHAEVAEVLKIDPKYDLGKFAKSLTYKNQVDKNRIVDAMRQAGLLDKSPSPPPEAPSAR